MPFIIGALAGVLVVFSVFFIDRRGIDDPVGAISVHGVCGAFGTLMVGLLATEGGLFYGDGFDQLVTQFIGVVAVFVFVTITTGLLFLGHQGHDRAAGAARGGDRRVSMSIEHGAPGYGPDVSATAPAAG